MSKKKRSSESRVAGVACQEDLSLLDEALSGIDDGGAAQRIVIRNAVEGGFESSEASSLNGAELVLVIATPRLVASGWPFSTDARQTVERAIRGEVELRVVDKGGDVTGSPLAADAQRKLRYEDDAHAKIGERLEALYSLRGSGDDAAVNAAIEKARAEIRRQGPRVGEQLADGRFRLLERIASGVFTTTWKGRDRKTGELVAIKFLHAHWAADPTAAGAFADGARQVGALSHPSISKVIVDRMDADGQSFSVTSWAAGVPLEKAAVDQAVPRAALIQALLDVSDALGTAHAAGVLHNDIRPGNVIVGDDGRGTLVDFDALDVLRPAGGVYLAPERLDPSSLVTARCDVYSLAMTTLYAFHRAPLPMWVLRDPERLVKGLAVSEGVKTAFRAALDWDLDQRTATPNAFADALLADAAVTAELADRALQLGQSAVAVAHLERLLAESPTADLLVRLGRAQAASGDAKTAAATFVRALGSPGLSEPAHAEVVSELEALEKQTGDARPLVDAYDTFAAREPDKRVHWLTAKARAVESLGDRKAARTAWESVLEAHDTRAVAREALDRLVGLAEADHDPQTAIRRLRERLAYTHEADRALLRYRIGKLHLGLGATGAALDWFESARAAGHEDPELNAQIEQIRTDRGEWQHAVAMLRERARDAAVPDAVERLTRAAAIATYGHRDDDAAAIHADLLAIDPANPGANLAAARSTRGPEALPLWVRAGASEDPAERVSDALQHARLLIAADRGEEAIKRLHEPIAAGHPTALELAIDESLATGALNEAAAMADRLRSVLHGLPATEMRVAYAAALAADVHWLNGDLKGAALRYDAALRAVPGHHQGWWGRTKVALRALREPAIAAELSPWQRSAPTRYAPEEPLARLLAALLDPRSMRAWLDLDPQTGASARAVGSDDPILLAIQVVDALTQRGIVGPSLFSRLVTTFPQAAPQIATLRHLWCESGVQFVVSDSYPWAGSAFPVALPRDSVRFDPIQQDLPEPFRPSRTALHGPLPLEKLLEHEAHIGPLPEPIEVPDVREPPAEPPRQAMLVVRGEGGDHTHRIDAEQFTIGKSSSDVVQIGTDGPPALAIIHRCGAVFYIEGGTERPKVEGREVREARLADEAVLEIGGVLVEFQADTADGYPRPRAINAADQELEDSDLLDEGDDLEVEPVTEAEPLERTDTPVPAPAAVMPVSTIPVAVAAAAVVEVTDPLPPDSPTLAPSDDVPMSDDPPSLVEEDPEHEPARKARRAALFYKDALGERLVPFMGDSFTIGPKVGADLKLDIGSGRPLRLVRKGDAIFVDDDAHKEVITGDRFDVGGHEIEFRFLADGYKAGAVIEDDVTAALDERGASELHATLMYMDGTKAGKVLALETFPYTIGRGKAASFQVQVDPKLSRVHCRIDRSHERYTVSDCGSVNGTFVNGEPVTDGLLRDGDRIVIGDSEFMFSLVAVEPVEEPPKLLDRVPVSRRATTEDAIAVDEGLDKIETANRALKALMDAMDAAEGPGSGSAALKLTLGGTSGRFAQLLDDVDYDGGLLPGMDILFNLARRPQREQRSLLNMALLDWIDKTLSSACDAVPPEKVDALLEQVAKVGFREKLRR